MNIIKKNDLLLVDRFKLKHKNFHSIDITDYNKINNLKKKKPDIILNYKPKKSNAELLLEAYNHYIKNEKIPEFGSGKKPKMGFFSIIKYFSKFI